jgi:PAS domain S-box-containing protein
VRVTVLSLTMPLVVLMVGLLQGQARMHAQRMNAQIQNNSRALRQSKEWLATTLQSIGDAVITTDTDGNITFMNPMAEQLTGWTEEEACEKSIETVFRVVDERTQQPLENLVQRVLATGAPVDVKQDACCWRATVARCSLRLCGTPICEGSQPDAEPCPVIGVVLVFRDTRERRQAEETIRRNEERYHSLVAATAQIIWTTPPAGGVTDMPMWRDYTGQTIEQVQGFGWLDAIHPDDRAHTTEAWKLALATQSVYETEYRIRRSDGEYLPFRVRGVPVLEADGSIREWVGTCTDISRRRRAEERLQSAITEKERTATELSGVLAQIAEGVVITDDQGNITSPTKWRTSFTVWIRWKIATAASTSSSTRKGTLCSLWKASRFPPRNCRWPAPFSGAKRDRPGDDDSAPGRHAHRGSGQRGAAKRRRRHETRCGAHRARRDGATRSYAGTDARQPHERRVSGHFVA